MMYESPKSEQLLVGLIRHLTIAETTSNPKQQRLESLKNISEVLEYILNNCSNENAEEDMLHRFFRHLLVKVKIADVQIHMNPMKFPEEIGFLTTLLKITSYK